MKFYLTLSVMFLVMINVALGAVGDVGISDTSATLQPEQSSSAGMDTNSYMPYESGLSSQASLNQPSLSSYGNYPAGPGLFPGPRIRLPGPPDQRADARAIDGRGAGTLAAANGELCSRCEFGFRVCLIAGQCSPGGIRAHAVYNSAFSAAFRAVFSSGCIARFQRLVLSTFRGFRQQIFCPDRLRL